MQRNERETAGDPTVPPAEAGKAVDPAPSLDIRI
jgi:hypothetical protein